MKKILLLFFVLTCFMSTAQVGIGTTTPSPSAKLEVASSNQGFLPPRIILTATSRNRHSCAYVVAHRLAAHERMRTLILATASPPGLTRPSELNARD